MWHLALLVDCAMEHFCRFKVRGNIAFAFRRLFFCLYIELAWRAWSLFMLFLAAFAQALY